MSSSGSLMKLLTPFVSHGISSSALRPPLNPLEQLTCLVASFRAERSSGALACVPASPLPALHGDFLACYHSWAWINTHAYKPLVIKDPGPWDPERLVGGALPRARPSTSPKVHRPHWLAVGTKWGFKYPMMVVEEVYEVRGRQGEGRDEASCLRCPLILQVVR